MLLMLARTLESSMLERTIEEVVSGYQNLNGLLKHAHLHLQKFQSTKRILKLTL